MMKQLHIRKITLLSLFLLLAILCTSCTGKGTQGDETTAAVSEQETQADPFAGYTKIIDAGSAAYVVVYPEDASYAVMQSMNRFIDNVYDQTGVRLETKSDFLRVGAEHDAEAREILFGRTNYSETDAVLATLASDQYAIREEGNKIVIAAHSDSYTVAASNYFTSNLMEPNLVWQGDVCTLYLQEYTFPSASLGEELSINGRFIRDFVIVYDADIEGYEEVAEQLQEVISATTGYVLDVYADTDREESDCEILIGQTNRALSAELYEGGRTLMTYELVVRGYQMQIVCGGPFSARECINEMRFSIFGGETMEYVDGSLLEVNLAPAAAEVTDGSDLRLMTANILAGRWGEDTNDAIPPVEQRVEIFAAVLANYTPDAVGLQETDHKWVEMLPVYLDILKNEYGIEYTWLFSVWEDGKPNLTSILYRSDKLELTDSDCKDNSYWNAASYTYHLRVLAWAKLRVKADPSQEFILLNTHWAWESPEWIAGSVQEETELVNQLKAEHGVPIFCTGDFNSRQDSEDVLGFLADTGMEETMMQAAEAGTRVNYCGGCGNVGNPRDSETYIDHIFGYGEYDVLRYETILGNRIIWLSDHAPQFADIQFQ